MGYNTTADMIANGNEMETVLHWHLTVNHYPPLPAILVGPCIEAIDLAIAGEWDIAVELPEGLTFRGQAVAPATQIIETCHLQSFIDSYEDRDI